MAKEPAGLRRWRLAHRKHKRRRVVHTMARRRRSYRGYKRHGRRGSKAIPILLAVPAVMPAYKAYTEVGLSKGLPAQVMMRYTGVNAAGQFDGGFVRDAAIPIIVGVIGHKVANRVGINRQIKKLTGGFLQL